MHEDTSLTKELRRMCVEAGSAGNLSLPVPVIESLLQRIKVGDEARERESRWVAHLQLLEMAGEERQ
jgi:hypothetical protein